MKTTRITLDIQWADEAPPECWDWPALLDLPDRDHVKVFGARLVHPKEEKEREDTDAARKARADFIYGQFEGRQGRGFAAALDRMTYSQIRDFADALGYFDEDQTA